MIDKLYNKSEVLLSYIGCFFIAFVGSCLGILLVGINSVSQANILQEEYVGSNLAYVFIYSTLIILIIAMLPYILHQFKSENQKAAASSDAYILQKSFKFMIAAGFGMVMAYALFFTLYSLYTGQTLGSEWYLLFR